MGTTKLDIWNRAVANVGQAGAVKIEDDTELTPDANNVRLYWDVTLRSFLEETWWSFATAYAELSVHASGKVGFWSYSYVRPGDCFQPRRILGPALQDQMPFEEGVVANASSHDAVIWSNQNDAVLEYTADVRNYDIWTGLAVIALSLKLAIDISPEYTGGTKKVQLLQARYDDALNRAQVGSHQRQERPTEENESFEFQDQRHGTTHGKKSGAWIDDA